MTRGVATGLAVAGGLLLAFGSVGLLPMLEEGVALRSAADRFELERPTGSAVGDSAVAYECAGTRILLSDDAVVGAPAGAARPRSVTVRVADTTITASPVDLHRDRTGPNRYWSRVVPFRWRELETGASECGIVYRLPPDTSGIARARVDSRRVPILDDIRGVRPAWQHGLRFRVLAWEAGEPGSIRARDLGYDDWREDPYGVYVANLLGGAAIGLRNQSLSYWPSYLFPLTYPLGLSLLGLVLLVVGLAGRLRARP
ncbi:MAG: hypothetical protein R3314_12030 [Longimicrobiales bacterium]|nr:hypothetical protein [Longimicrobiales bacterium]